MFWELYLSLVFYFICIFVKILLEVDEFIVYLLFVEYGGRGGDGCCKNEVKWGILIYDLYENELKCIEVCDESFWKYWWDDFFVFW